MPAAQKNRERVIVIENERIEKDRLLDVITRDQENELTRIAAEKGEGERREITEVIRERVAVDRTVAEQEVPIEKLRAVEEAKRLASPREPCRFPFREPFSRAEAPSDYPTFLRCNTSPRHPYGGTRRPPCSRPRREAELSYTILPMKAPP